MITIKNITKTYNGIHILKNISYEFKKGIYLITGSSGKGKTTLLNIMSGKDKKYSGQVSVKEEIFYFRDKDNLPSELKVQEIYKLYEDINNIKLKKYFDVIENKKAKKLSIGEKQLVVLNLILNSNNKIIVLDEPLSALSSSNMKKAAKLIEKLSKEKVIIIATHNMNVFKKYSLLDLDNYRHVRIKKNIKDEFYNKVKPFKLKYYLFYLKKTIVRKIIFILTIAMTVFNYFYIANYNKSFTSNYLLSVESEKGIIIERVNEVKELNENVFYEVIKKISKYAYNYNGNYYSSNLYNYNVMVDNYYIDNAAVFFSFEYVEEYLNEDEIIIGLNYNNFCKKNNIVTCNENHLKKVLNNKKIETFEYRVKDIFYSDKTVVLNNRRFNKIYEINDYQEFYFDIKKEDATNVFAIINEDDFLLNFDFVKIGENKEDIRYKVTLDETKNFHHEIDYDDYVVCLKKGYDCLNYLNHFKTLEAIEQFKDISNLTLGNITQELNLDEIVISSKLASEINKIKGDTITFYFNYNDTIKEVKLMVKDIIKNEKCVIYHNNDWSYEFFKEKVCFEQEDLIIENILIFEEIKEGYAISENPYELALKDIRRLIKDTNKVVSFINVSLNLGSLIVLFILENYCNKFKKEYFKYLSIING